LENISKKNSAYTIPERRFSKEEGISTVGNDTNADFTRKDICVCSYLQ
jgi:hypothetical protein